MPVEMLMILAAVALVVAGVGIGFIWGSSSGWARAFRECARLFDAD